MFLRAMREYVFVSDTVLQIILQTASNAKTDTYGVMGTFNLQEKGGRKSEKEKIFRSSNGDCYDIVYGCMWWGADQQ